MVAAARRKNSFFKDPTSLIKFGLKSLLSRRGSMRTEFLRQLSITDPIDDQVSRYTALRTINGSELEDRKASICQREYSLPHRKYLFSNGCNINHYVEQSSNKKLTTPWSNNSIQESQLNSLFLNGSMF